MSEQNSQEEKLAQTGILPDNPRARMMPATPSRVAPIPEGPPPWRIIIQISGQVHQQVGLEVRDKILIGRAAPNTDQQPELDLNPYGGADNGVSRRHAMITLIDQCLFVSDLGSTNGTKLNGFLLPPDQQFRLRDGDELRLGTMRLIIRFLKSPF